MAKKAKGNILGNTKILDDKTYQDFNKESPDPRDPVQKEVVEIAEAAEAKEEIDIDAVPNVGARDKNIKVETIIKKIKK
jgi:hypothetical protein